MEADIKINYTALAMKVIDQLYDKISTTKIDELTAEQCASMSSTHPDYNALAEALRHCCAGFRIASTLEQCCSLGQIVAWRAHGKGK